MRVSFKVNLGSIDAERCGVDFKKCTVGESVDCEDAAGKWLVAKGIATEVVVPKPPEPEPEPEPVPVVVPVVEEPVIVPPVEEKTPEPVEPTVETQPEAQPEPVVETKPAKNKK